MVSQAGALVLRLKGTLWNRDYAVNLLRDPCTVVKDGKMFSDKQRVGQDIQTEALFVSGTWNL